MGWNGMGSGWMWLVMLAVIVGFWAVVVVLLRAVLRDRARDRDRDAVEPTLESPLVILDRRLVSGEIDIDEYVQLRRAITSGH
ncbi:MAG: SHOCT domain-containing protein [Dermatophilaceae bacterium]|nr:SHOCT domain-containing protein [Dermatophilaceae bacterium]